MWKGCLCGGGCYCVRRCLWGGVSEYVCGVFVCVSV